MNSPKPTLILLVLTLTTNSIVVAVSNDTKEVKISNYEPSQSNVATQLLNDNHQVVSYTFPWRPLNSNRTNNSKNLGDDKQEFLKAHNGARQRSGLTPLVWDAKLAKYAALYSSNRHDDCDLEHSYGKYGENIFWGSGNEWTPAEVVKLWVKEHRYYNRQTKECAKGKMCGHYTQIMWRNTRHLGCAKIRCGTGDTFAICNYDPPGNVIGKGPFDSNN